MMNGNKGFTLVELVVVIGIISVLMAISAPGLIEWSRNAKFKEAAQLAASSLRQAKGQAINLNQQVAVVFDLNNLTGGKDSVKIGAGTETTFDGIELRRGMPNCDVASGTVSITFNPNGSSNNSFICISDGDIRKYRVGVSTANTGRILLQKFQQDGTPVLGTILNDWVPGLNGYGYDKKYYDRYAKYYNVKKD